MHYITLILLTRIFISIFSALLKVVSEDGINPFQITFMYNAISMFFIVFWLLIKGHNIKFIKTKRIKLFAFRGLLEFIGFALICYSVKFIPLPAFSALGFTQPILVSIAAIIMLKEKSYPHNWLALLGGFIGAMIIIRPTGEGLVLESLYRILATILFALCAVAIKRLTNTEKIMKIVFYFTFFITLFSTPFALIFWQTPSLIHIGLLIAMGIFSLLAQLCISKAFSKTDVSNIMPFYFVDLILLSFIAYFAFDEVITIWTIIGAVVIIKSAIYGAYKTKKLAMNI